MRRGGVDETGTGIIGDVVAGQKRHGEIVAEILEWMSGGDGCELIGRDIAQAAEGELCLGGGFFRQLVGKDQLFARTRTEIVFAAVTS